jgi:DNA polymerase epsilon subunit 4
VTKESHLLNSMSENSSQDELEELESEKTPDQDAHTLSEDENIAEAVQDGEPNGDEPPTKKRRIRKEPGILTRESGKSLLPFSRVQKIIKADKVFSCSKCPLCFLVDVRALVGDPYRGKGCDVLNIACDGGIC